MLEATPPDGRGRYQALLALRRSALLRLSTAGRSADGALRAVLHALTASQPRARYVVGADAKLGVTLARWLPDSVRSWLAEARRRMTRT